MVESTRRLTIPQELALMHLLLTDAVRLEIHHPHTALIAYEKIDRPVENHRLRMALQLDSEGKTHLALD